MPVFGAENAPWDAIFTLWQVVEMTLVSISRQQRGELW